MPLDRHCVQCKEQPFEMEWCFIVATDNEAVAIMVCGDCVDEHGHETIAQRYLTAQGKQFIRRELDE